MFPNMNRQMLHTDALGLRATKLTLLSLLTLYITVTVT
jgi:hypothetical protein